MANIVSRRYQIFASSQPLIQTRDASPSPSTQTTVTCVYTTHISGAWRNVTVTWIKNVMNYTLTISVESSTANDVVYTCKIDLKPWNIWAKKGSKSFEIDAAAAAGGTTKLDTYWDLKSAKFAGSGSPEPISDYYVALISKSEVVLLLGDCKKKAYKRTKSRPALMDAALIHKKETVFAKKTFSTRAKFDHRRPDHDIVVESSTAGPRDPAMWISIDGIVSIHVENLQWKFRGSQTVVVDQQPVRVFWDVYAWLFCEPGANHGLFIFKSGDSDGDSDDDSSQCSGDSSYYSCKGSSSQLSHFLYAWKI